MKKVQLKKHSHNFIDLSNQRFGKLKVIKIIKSVNDNVFYWLCRCICGNEKIIRGLHLRNGKIKSCGCLQKEILKKRNYKHGMRKKSFYNIWLNLKQRCDNPKNPEYKNYGGRGITYDSRWENFLEFKKDMHICYLINKYKFKKELISIERKNVNGNYCKENCTFIPMKLQAKNTRKTKNFIATSPEGIIYESKNQNEFSLKFNLNQRSINSCLNGKLNQHKGWLFEYK